MRWRTERHLAELTVWWLEGHLSRTPYYASPVDTDEPAAPGLTAALVAANHAGFLTFNSQAGTEGDGLAMVTGFAALPVCEAYAAALVPAGFPVEWGPITTWFGRRSHPFDYRTPTRRSIANAYACVAPAAINDIAAGCWLAVWDAEPGENRLWSALHHASGLVHVRPGST